jgi:hypothetical protein
MRLHNPSTRPELTQAERLVADGRVVEAIDLLVAANRRRRDAEIEIRLVDLRHEAARTLEPDRGRSPWPPGYDDPFPDVAGRLPEIEAAVLDPQVLGGAVAHHGGLVVRGLFGDAQVTRTVELIDQIQAQREGAPDRPLDGALYRPFDLNGKRLQEALRDMVASQGGTWMADSPAGTAHVLDELASVGVIDAIAGHLGERPSFSLQKSTLRRSIPKNKLVAWHQDGSFLDEGVRTMNVWLALSRCGGDHPAPGMEVVPKRVPEVLPVDGELTPHSISEALVAEIAADAPVIRPEFEPGDAMLFDERFLHRTYLNPFMTEVRYAIECWLFAPSHRSSGYLPFLV